MHPSSSPTYAKLESSLADRFHFTVLPLQNDGCRSHHGKRESTGSPHLPRSVSSRKAHKSLPMAPVLRTWPKVPHPTARKASCVSWKSKMTQDLMSPACCCIPPSFFSSGTKFLPKANTVIRTLLFWCFPPAIALIITSS